AYRALGYKVCGERAVRVDILERLADLIRAALSWREGNLAPKPAGAFDGRSFSVAQPMTSLVGSAGEDFAAILRALGYRMDRRPPLPVAPSPPIVAEPASEAVSQDVAADANAGGAATAEVPSESADQATVCEIVPEAAGEA